MRKAFVDALWVCAMLGTAFVAVVSGGLGILATVHGHWILGPLGGLAGLLVGLTGLAFCIEHP